MRKIPTLYVRDPNNRRFVTDQVTPGCEWVLNGEGTAELISGATNSAGHGSQTVELPADNIKDYVDYVGMHGWEGVVWRHPDGRMAKLKARDLR